ncbi:hypothetical protein GCM10011609_82410 [Lentzea pudingi]|uniref:Response regulator receiver domain-containing protein n=1 Tax=Lentzea pudingi TaxID=1789439 RepID=A0ABQ2IRZ7_9PSEU|nr:hypothetical protein [Lentzea pudingi]GGN27228.1 hypothetical protein GCM10011609_82410 [Lentzea pudingi]
MTASIEVEGRHNTIAGRDLITISAGGGLVRQVFGDQILPTTLTWQRDRFAEPVGFLAAVEFLRVNKFLLLTAASGARTAALCLLHDVHREARMVEHVEVEQDTELRLRRVSEDALVLIDFRTAEDTSPVEAQIGGFIREQVPEGHVVVLLSGNESEEFQGRYGHLHRSLPKPLSHEVLHAHLRHDLPGDRLDLLLKDADWLELAEGARPADVVHFADLFMRAWRDAPQGNPTRDALEAFHKYAKTLANQFDSRSARERSVLLALALVNNGRHESIYRAERILLDLTDHQDEDPRQVLASEGFVSRLTKIADATTSLDRTRLTRRDYDTSVLNHVWRGFPQLREHLSDWIIEVVFDEQARLEPQTRGEIAVRLLTLCTDTRDAKPLLAAVQKWAQHNIALAAGLLDEAAVNENTTVEVRRRMYWWARSSDLPVPLARAVIDACAAKFGVLYPQFALTRLGHLTGHFRADVVRRVEAAMLVLAKERGNADVVLVRMTEWLRTSTGEQWAAAAFVVRELTMPGNGFRSSDDSGVVAWRAILRSSNHSGVVRGLSDWFSAAAAAGAGARTAAFGLVLDAAGDDVNALNLLSMSVDRWKRDQPEGRTEVHDELRRRIDAQHPVVRR